jgi:hypothetical protein
MTRLEDVFKWEHFPFTPFPGKVSNREHLPVFHPDLKGQRGQDHVYLRSTAIVFILHVGPILRHFCDHVMEFSQGVKLQLGTVWPFPVKRCRICQGLPKPLLEWSSFDWRSMSQCVFRLQTKDYLVMLYRFFVVASACCLYHFKRVGTSQMDVTMVMAPLWNVALIQNVLTLNFFNNKHRQVKLCNLHGGMMLSRPTAIIG